MAFRAHFVVDVVANKNSVDLDPDDMSVDGQSPAYGAYLITVKLEKDEVEMREDALNTWHANVGINRKEDFVFMVRRASTDEVMRPVEHGLDYQFQSDSLNEPGGNSMEDEKITMIVEVTAVADFENLPAAELADDGTPSRDGSYRITVTDYAGDIPRDQTMSLFQDLVEEFEDDEHYQFTVRPATAEEIEAAPDTFRQDLGIQSAHHHQPSGGMAP